MEASSSSDSTPDSLADALTSVALGAMKSVGEQPAMLANLAYSNTIANVNLAQQNAVANQQAMNEVGVAVVGKTVTAISRLGPVESASATDVLTGNAVASDLAALKTATESR